MDRETEREMYSSWGGLYVLQAAALPGRPARPASGTPACNFVIDQ